MTPLNWITTLCYMQKMAHYIKCNSRVFIRLAIHWIRPLGLKFESVGKIELSAKVSVEVKQLFSLETALNIYKKEYL